jgi:DNA replication protein DnaC
MMAEYAWDQKLEDLRAAAKICARCGGTGWSMPFAAGGDEEQMTCDCQKAIRRQQGICRTIRQSQIPDRWLTVCRFADLETPTPEEERLKEAAWAWANWEEGTPLNLVLHGDVGVGKTHVGIAAALWRMEEWRSRTIFWDVPGVLDEVRRGFGHRQARRVWDDDADDYVEVDPIEEACAADTLVLDDLGVQRDTEWVVETLYRVVNARYEHERDTIVTTNLDPWMLATEGSLDEQRLWSRIVADARVLKVEGPNRRLAGMPLRIVGGGSDG